MLYIDICIYKNLYISTIRQHTIELLADVYLQTNFYIKFHLYFVKMLTRNCVVYHQQARCQVGEFQVNKNYEWTESIYNLSFFVEETAFIIIFPFFKDKLKGFILIATKYLKYLYKTIWVLFYFCYFQVYICIIIKTVKGNKSKRCKCRESKNKIISRYMYNNAG